MILLACGVVRSRSPYAETGPVYSSSNGRLTGQLPGLDRLRSRSAAGPELLVELDRTGELPLHEQLERSLREDIRARAPCAPARGCPPRAGSPRSSASRAASSPRLTASSPPRAIWRAARAPPCESPAPCARLSRARAARSLLPTFPYHFHPGLPDLAGFPRDRWLRSLRAAWASPRWTPWATATRAACRGCAKRSPTISRACAEPASDPENMLMCTGFMQGFSILCRWLHSQGIEAIAVEDPGWQVHRLIAEQAGLRGDPRAGRRAGPARGRARAHRRHRRARDPRAPVPHRERAQSRAPRGADRMGRGRESG